MLSIFLRVSHVLNLFKKEYWRYRWFLLIQVFLSFFGSMLEGIGINAIIPLFSFVNHNQVSSSDSITQFIGGFFAYFHLPFTLKSLLVFIILLFLFKSAIVYLTTYISSKINASYERNTRSNLFKLTLSANWPYLSRQKVGHLEQVLTTDVNYSTSLLNYLSSIALIVTSAMVYFLISANISLIIAVSTVSFGLLVLLFFKPLFYKNRIYSTNVENIFKGMAHFVNESVVGMKTIKAISIEKEVQKIGDVYFEKLKQNNLDIINVRNITNSSMQPIGLIFIIILFAFFYKTTNFNFASFAVIVYAINKMFAYIQLAQTQMHGVISLVPFVRSVQTYREMALSHKEEDKGVGHFSFKNNIQFKNVGFNYGSNDSLILSNLNLNIKKGEMIGLVGSSGAGKTTMIDLILRLHQPSQGTILVDGKDLSLMSVKNWRKNIGYVSQDNFLLNDTIENNIKFYDDSVTTEDVIRASKMANIYEFINRQSGKFLTVVGERGIKLSGGERQRVVLARILARSPEILILDEATSALDNESELLIQQAIENLKGKTTVIIVAHRLTTVLDSDRILVLDNGQIKEEGTPAELMENKDSYFYRVYNLKKI